MSDQPPQDNELDEAAHEIAVADSLYQGFPDCSSWAKQTVQTDVWDRWIGGLTAERSSASSEDFKQAVEIAMRAAAIDTGAIEGLYEVDRGFAMTVATQATAWQAQLEERGRYDQQALQEADQGNLTGRSAVHAADLGRRLTRHPPGQITSSEDIPEPEVVGFLARRLVSGQGCSACDSEAGQGSIDRCRP